MSAFSSSAIKMIVFAVVTILLTTVLAMTVANSTVGSTTSYSALFTDASGLQSGDDVRIDGVKVGEVQNLSVVNNQYALVRFSVESDRRLGGATSAAIKYRNLVGQRYLALNAGISNPKDLLPYGATIPLNRTQPALNLTELFNGFKPLFQALSPKDVNQLSFEIIQVLQGEGGTVDNLLQHTASLTTTIAQRDQVIGQVITNLNTVMGTVNQDGPQLGQLIQGLQQMVTGFAQQRQSVGNAITALNSLTQTTSGLVAQARPPLAGDISQLNAVTKNLDAGLPEMEKDIQELPNRLDALTRTVSYGGWFNFYLCNLSGTISISSLGIKVPIIPYPGTQMAPRCK
jgi:phospholipid/cholesterol/gamma-HCH transport system substrate-binding protein